MKATEILFSLLNMSEKAGIEFLQAKQRETGYTPETFHEFLEMELNSVYSEWWDYSSRLVEAGRYSPKEQNTIKMELYKYGFSGWINKDSLDMLKRSLLKYKFDFIFKKFEEASKALNIKGEGETQRVLAFYYIYIQAEDKKLCFENQQGGKRKAIERIAESKNISATKFELVYNEMSKARNKKSFTKQMTKPIQKAIELMQDYPKAVELANEDLNYIETHCN